MPLTNIQPHLPFSFAETLRFVRSFPPLAAQVILERDALTAAIAIGGHAYAYTLRAAPDHGLSIETEAPERIRPELARRVADFVGANDDLDGFYARAEADPPMRKLIAAHRGLRHVRFLGGLAEIAVYSVLMQRTPVARATRLEQSFLARFGLPAGAGEHALRAMPELVALAALDERDIADAIGHLAKATRIATVVRGVAAIGERFLREAPYSEARDALLAISGIGPFSAAAILLRGLGRMDELPMERFASAGRRLYGRAWDPDAVARRYGEHIGYWSFYLKALA